MGDSPDSTSNDSLATNEANSKEHPTTESAEVAVEQLAQSVQDLLVVEKRHEFWETQPVVQFKDIGDDSLPEGPIEQPVPLSELRHEPHDLPDGYEWTTCDMESEETSNLVYNFLMNNYVEDDENMFRFNYSKEFLQWAVCGPGYYKTWHLGVRLKTSQELVAFVTGVPARIKVQDRVFPMAELDFLCVHKEHRLRRLTPALIKEVTRRFRLENVWQTAFTSGTLLPTPIATCRYWHRPLNPTKLIEVGFSRLGPRMTMSRTQKLYELPDSTITPGLRRMEIHDVPAVTRLLRDYLGGFFLAPEFDELDVQHWLLPREDIVDAYVVEDPETREVTDLCSFYTVPTTIIGNPDYQMLKAAYSYYNVAIKTPLIQLMNDALILAKKNDHDVFNALDVMDNESFFRELMFGCGDGQLQYYLYNYRFRYPISPSKVGLVLL